MADKGFRFNTYQSDRETHQHIGYQLKRIADAMEQDNLEQSNTQATPLKCSFCDCVDPNAIQMRAVNTPGNMQPVCEYCNDKYEEACMEAEADTRAADHPLHQSTIDAIGKIAAAHSIIQQAARESHNDDA